MPLFRELTEGQRDPLFRLVDYQSNRSTSEVRFYADSTGPMFQIGEYKDGLQEAIVKIPIEFIKTWEDFGYITLSNSAFILRKEALDYADFMKKSNFQRVMITIGHYLFVDISSLVWPIVVSIITTVIVYFILRGIGAKP
jgi:hypothetical protein